jgi:nitrogen fixation NifU-like protein
MYSAAVLDHFQNPRHAGTLADPTASIQVSNPVCGDVLELSVRVEEGRIIDARFRIRGCVTSMACSSLLTELVIDKSTDELRSITPQRISDQLGGLPPATFHGAQLACAAVTELLRKLGR